MVWPNPALPPAAGAANRFWVFPVSGPFRLPVPRPV